MTTTPLHDVTGTPLHDVTGTPLHDVHRRLGATFTTFAGWSMPLRYGSDLAEHHAVRRTLTSGALSPTLGHPVAMACISAGHSVPGTRLTVDVRGTRVDAEVVSLPFYKR